MGCTFIISKRDYSEKAGEKYGHPWVWRTLAVIRQRPPSDEEGFQLWLWNLVKSEEYGGAGIYKVVRTAAYGERRGFHPVFYGHVDADYIRPDRKYTNFKGIPSLPKSRDLWYKKPEERVKFHTSGKRFG